MADKINLKYKVQNAVSQRPPITVFQKGEKK